MLTKKQLKRVWAWLTPLDHTRAKIMAARQGDYLEEMIRKAVLAYLDRGEKEEAGRE